MDLSRDRVLGNLIGQRGGSATSGGGGQHSRGKERGNRRIESGERWPEKLGDTEKKARDSEEIKERELLRQVYHKWKYILQSCIN